MDLKQLDLKQLRKVTFWLSRLSKRERSILWLCTIVVLSSLLYVIWIEPLVGSRREIRQEIAKKKIELERLERKVIMDGKLRSQFSSLLQRATSQVPKEERRTALVTQLENLAKGAKVNIVDLKPLKSRKYDFYEELSAQLRIECDLDALSRFLYNMMISPQILDVRRLQIRLKGGSKSLDGDLLVSTILIEEKGE